MYFDMWNLFSLAAILNFAVSWWKASNLNNLGLGTDSVQSENFQKIESLAK